MIILNERQIEQKIKRLAYEIIEHNFDETSLIVAGINKNGLYFAQLLVNQLVELCDIEIQLTQIKLNPANPLAGDIAIDMPLAQLHDKVILVVDDVANTGRTLFYAAKPLMNVLPRKVEFVVLVDRKHKAFPIAPNYVGFSLATTLKENIDVQLEDVIEKTVFLR